MTTGRADLTVVIPTLGRDAAALARAVETSVAVAERVVVVRQGGAGTHGAALGETVRGADLIEDTGLGASHARNTGLAATRTEWVLFLDDDAALLPGFSSVAAAAAGMDGCGAVAWRVVDEDGSDISRFRDAPARLTAFNHWNLTREHSMLWRTDVLRRLGGFDESIGPGRWAGAEECSDLMIRFLASGGVGRYVPITASTHPGTEQIDAAKARTYGRGSGRVIRKHLLVPASWPFALRTIAGLGSIVLPARMHRFPRRTKQARGRGIAEGLAGRR